MKANTLKVRITGISPILGSVTADKEIYKNFIKAKTATPEEAARADKDAEDLPSMDETLTNKTTVFYRDSDGDINIKAYQIKGFLKEAAKVLKDQLKLGSPASKIDNLVFIAPDSCKILNADGNPIKEADMIFERPQRCETMQGPRVSLARSEYLNEGWNFEITIRVLENNGTAKSKPITVDMVKDLLDYGELKGLLQWRNGGYGSFKYEVLEEN